MPAISTVTMASIFLTMAAVQWPLFNDLSFRRSLFDGRARWPQWPRFSMAAAQWSRAMTSFLDGLSLMIASQFDSRCCSMRLTITLFSFLNGLFLMTASRFGGRCCSMTACSMTSLLACTCRCAFCGRCTPHVCCAPQTVVLLVATFMMNPYHNPSWAQCFRNVSVGSALVTPSASISELLIHSTVSSFSSISSVM